jgi:oligopeptide/dipeptide ABC transporter ATP-binding protein
MTARAGETLMRLENLSVTFAASGATPGGHRRFRAVDDVTLDVVRGEVVGLVGESGSGKTTLAKALLRLYRPNEGRILYRGTDLAALGERALKPYRRDMQMVFQDPLSSFNPRHTIFEALAIPLRLHKVCPSTEIPQRVAKTLKRVGLSPTLKDRYPHELSGGQLQRVAIGRALTLSPTLLVADEAVSKLDVSLRSQILNLLNDLRESFGLSILFITHDLHVARYLCDRVGVMYFGKLVELGRTEQVFSSSRHPYTRALLGTLEEELSTQHSEETIAPPSATGCRYASRCLYRIERCSSAHPPVDVVEHGHTVACYRWRELPNDRI